MREDLTRAQSELAAQRSQTELLTQKVAMLTEQSREAAAASKQAFGTGSDQEPAERASLRVGNTAPVRELSRSSEASTLNSSRERALDGMRGGYQSDLNQLRDQIATRDRLFSTYDQSRTAVKFRPSPAISSRGLTPAQIASQIKSASAVYQLSLLKRDIQEIRAKVSDDIALMNRMKGAKR